MQTQNELQKKEEKEREEEKERRRQLEEILNNMKQEDDTPIPTPSLLEEFSNLDLSRNRRRQNSTENNLSFRTTVPPARLKRIIL